MRISSSPSSSASCSGTGDSTRRYWRGSSRRTRRSIVEGMAPPYPACAPDARPLSLPVVGQVASETRREGSEQRRRSSATPSSGATEQRSIATQIDPLPRFPAAVRCAKRRGMVELVAPYSTAVASYVVLGVLILIQVLVADVAGMRAGHVPGMAIAGGHDDFLFRATRAHANTNESLATFVLLSLAAILLRANAPLTNGFAAVFVTSRAAHMLAYYADQRTLRSTAFVVGLVCLIGLAVCAALALR